jgi:hypothetical protein
MADSEEEEPRVNNPGHSETYSNDPDRKRDPDSGNDEDE